MVKAGSGKFRRHNPASLDKKLVEKLIGLLTPALLYMDRRTKITDRTTTGYFIRADKRSAPAGA